MDASQNETPLDGSFIPGPPSDTVQRVAGEQCEVVSVE